MAIRMKIKFRKGFKLGFREKLIVLSPALVIVVVAFAVAYLFVDPIPPRHISIGCGPPGGANHNFAKAYQEILAKDGIKLALRNTAGSAENLKLLSAESGGVDVAFVQGSMKSLAQGTDLLSLGSLFFEPLWIFYRGDLNVRRIPDLKGLRLAVGEEGGGTKILTMQLLNLNGIDSENTQILSHGYQKAAKMLLNSQVDAAFFVSTHRASHVISLIDSESLKLMGLERADAYALLLHYLYVLKVPEGVINFEANIPDRDLTLVAPTTQLVTRSDLHPALVNLLLTAANMVHKSGGEFEREGEFPTPKYLDFKLSPDAERFYKFGTPFLQRYLPFWMAIFVSRMAILLLPLVAVVLPLFKVMPIAYRWRMRSKIYRWYSKLRTFDPERHKEESSENLQKYLAKLSEIEEKVANISVPLAYSEELYHLRMHIDMLRSKLKQML